MKIKVPDPRALLMLFDKRIYTRCPAEGEHPDSAEHFKTLLDYEANARKLQHALNWLVWLPAVLAFFMPFVPSLGLSLTVLLLGSMTIFLTLRAHKIEMWIMTSYRAFLAREQKRLIKELEGEP